MQTCKQYSAINKKIIFCKGLFYHNLQSGSSKRYILLESGNKINCLIIWLNKQLIECSWWGQCNVWVQLRNRWIGEVSWVHKQNHYRESFHIFPADSRNNTARLINKRCVLWLPSEPTKCQMYCSSSPFIFLLVAFSRGKETTPTLTQDPSHTTMQHGKTRHQRLWKNWHVHGATD